MNIYTDVSDGLLIDATVVMEVDRCGRTTFIAMVPKHISQTVHTTALTEADIIVDMAIVDTTVILPASNVPQVLLLLRSVYNRS